MDELMITGVGEKDLKSASAILDRLIQLNSNKFAFPELDYKDMRVQLWSALFEHLQNPSASSIHHLCLTNIRILSRDKRNLDDLVCEKWINVLLELSGLYQLTLADEELLPNESSPDSVKIEALKCLCNLVYNSPATQALCASNCSVEGIISRLRTYKDMEIPHEMKFYDMKLLFIITALRPEKRDVVKDELHGLAYLVECLDEIIKEITPCGTAAISGVMVEGDHQYFINDTQLDLVIEILKILFNLVLQCNVDAELNEQEEVYILRLVSICNNLLLCKSSSKEKEQDLYNNVVNFLTSIPVSCYSQLAPIITENMSTYKNHQFEGRNMEAVHNLIKYLQLKMSQTQNVTVQYENLSPILSVMYKAASSNVYLRKYLRAVILPPLKDVHTRPEEGNTVRNQLCRLLTTPVTHVRDLAAQFLFILCKENVSRMVKYTGYGNAAGLFATRGLLGPNKQSIGECLYSSDSDDSDTEEYRAMRHTVNPVTGCYEPPHADPMAGCTEEQKEYEAMKLVNLMDQLNRAGIVQPCRIGPDGKPVPVEHILQLQEDLPNQQLHNA